MKLSTISTTPIERAGALVLAFVGSMFVTFAIVLTLRKLGVIPNPATLTAQKTTGEFIIRFFLAGFLSSCYLAIFLNRQIRDWFLDQRWRLVMLVLFGLGAVFAMADPFHPIRGEENWIRYWTAGVLFLAGTLAIMNTTRRAHPIPDRIFGSLFGCLLVFASADEMFQFHEKAGDIIASALRLGQMEEANDIPTLVVAVLGVVTLVTLILLLFSRGRVGRTLRLGRYRTPLRLFAFSVITFAVAMSLDSFDIYLEKGVKYLHALISDESGGVQDRLWLALTDVRALANSMEELLEYLAALGLLMMVLNLFSLTAIGSWEDSSSA